MNTFGPMHPVVLRDKKRPGKQLVEVHRGRRTGQFAVINQAASWREQLQAGFEGGGTDWIKHGGDTAATGIGVYGFTHIIDRPVDNVGGPCGPSGVHPPAFGDSDVAMCQAWSQEHRELI